MNDISGGRGAAAELIPTPLEPLTVTIQEAMRLTGVGRNSIINGIERGELESVKAFNRRLIIYPSIKRMIAERATVPYEDTKRGNRRKAPW
jgi:hypothetical protein